MQTTCRPVMRIRTDRSKLCHLLQLLTNLSISLNVFFYVHRMSVVRRELSIVTFALKAILC